MLGSNPGLLDWQQDVLTTRLHPRLKCIIWSKYVSIWFTAEEKCYPNLASCYLTPALRIQDPELFWPLDPGSETEKIRILHSVSQIPTSQIIFTRESLVTFFGLKILCCGSGSGILCLFNPGSGMKKFGSGINIPDQVHTALSFVFQSRILCHV